MASEWALISVTTERTILHTLKKQADAFIYRSCSKNNPLLNEVQQTGLWRIQVLSFKHKKTWDGVCCIVCEQKGRFNVWLWLKKEGGTDPGEPDIYSGTK